jgi:signal transduction histidine kinase
MPRGCAQCFSPAVNARVKYLTGIAGLAAAYAAIARAGLTFDPLAGFATLVWPATGVALAGLLIFGTRFWPGVFLGSLLANLLMGAPILVAAGIGVGNTLEAVVGATLMRRTPNYLRTLESVATAVMLIVGAATFATLISATIGVGSLYAGQIIPGARVSSAWQSWWVGDMVGALLVAPIILVWSAKPRARFSQHWMETPALLAATIAVSVVAFFENPQGLPTFATPFHKGALLLGIVTWAALRYGQRGAVTTTFYLSAIATAATVSGRGPFAVPDHYLSMLSLQTAMAIVAATTLLLGATIADRRTALDRARTARDEAAKANEARSNFLTVMSHELRTPLNAIAGFSELLRTGVYGPLNNKQAEALERIERNERDLLRQIDEVLTFVKLDKGEVGAHTEVVPVADAFNAVEPSIASTVMHKHVQLRRQLPGALAVQADRKGLEQILTSLVSNASKFTPDGGEITLGADRVDGRVRIWVRDTGIGIAREEIEKVFEPFFQAERGTTRRYNGVGLGLTVARDLARGMKGEVTIASEVGAGTTATVVLPAA